MCPFWFSNHYHNAFIWILLNSWWAFWSSAHSLLPNSSLLLRTLQLLRFVPWTPVREFLSVDHVDLLLTWQSSGGSQHRVRDPIPTLVKTYSSNRILHPSYRVNKHDLRKITIFTNEQDGMQCTHSCSSKLTSISISSTMFNLFITSTHSLSFFL